MAPAAAKKTKSKADAKSAMTTNAPANDTTADASNLDYVPEATQPAPKATTVKVENKKKKSGTKKAKMQVRGPPKKRRFGQKPRRNFK
jgi:hypothetical protein